MLHSKVYLNTYVVSIAPFSYLAFTPHPSLPFRKLVVFACFRFLIFHPFSRGSADPICPYVRTPMRVHSCFRHEVDTVSQSAEMRETEGERVYWLSASVSHRPRPVHNPVHVFAEQINVDHGGHTNSKSSAASNGDLQQRHLLQSLTLLETCLRPVSRQDGRPVDLSTFTGQRLGHDTR